MVASEVIYLQRQLVPRPLSFLSNPPLANVQTPKPIAVTDPVPPVNPLQISQVGDPLQNVVTVPYGVCVFLMMF